MKNKTTLDTDLTPLNINGVIHVGADEGQTAGYYHKLGVNRVMWFEKDSKRYNKIYPNTAKYGMKQNYLEAELSDMTAGSKKAFIDVWRENASFIDVDTYDLLNVACKSNQIEILKGFDFHLKGFRAIVFTDLDVDAFAFNDDIQKFMESNGFKSVMFSTTEKLFIREGLPNVYW